ncbi:MAG: nucleoside deaminase, partial [Flavobacteriales bacterium]|nr:nucleoside deaminase [Flavobacteriales bacterium]
MLSAFSDEHFMKEAFKEAQKAFDEDEVPVGAIIVCDNKIIARAHNMTERLN